MEEDKTKINSYSVNQLQNDFIGLKKNPQKYVEFQLNADNTANPDAGGLYELLPYYQKINPLGEKANYAIQWFGFENKWQLIKVTPLGELPRLDVEQTTIATLLEGDQFSRPTDADIKTYTTYQHMKSVVKTVGEVNKELKNKIIEVEKEIISVREANKSLEERLTKSREQNKKCKVYILEQNQKKNSYALEQQCITEKANELYKMKTKEHETSLEEIEKLKLNLKEKKIQIEKQNAEKRALEYQNGDLAYKLSHVSECKQNFLSLEKEAKKQLKEQLKYYQAEKQKCDESSKQWEIQVVEVKKLLHRQVAEIMTLRQELKNCNEKAQLERDIFTKYKNEKEKEIKQIWLKKEIEFKESLKTSIQQDIEEFENDMDKQNEIKFQKLYAMFNDEKKELQKEIKQQKLDLIKKDGLEIQIKMLKKQCKELQDENENLQAHLEMREVILQAYDTPPKTFKNDNISSNKY